RAQTCTDQNAIEAALPQLFAQYSCRRLSQVDQAVLDFVPRSSHAVQLRVDERPDHCRAVTAHRLRVYEHRVETQRKHCRHRTTPIDVVRRRILSPPRDHGEQQCQQRDGRYSVHWPHCRRSTHAAGRKTPPLPHKSFASKPTLSRRRIRFSMSWNSRHWRAKRCRLRTTRTSRRVLTTTSRSPAITTRSRTTR